MRRMMKFGAIFSLLMGAALLSTWIVMFAIGNVPEISAKPLETALLLVAEVSTGLALIIGGYGVLKKRPWGRLANLASLGMLLYCVINYIGVLAQQGTWPAVGWFTLVTIFTVIFILDYLYHSLVTKTA